MFCGNHRTLISVDLTWLLVFSIPFMQLSSFSVIGWIIRSHQLAPSVHFSKQEVEHFTRMFQCPHFTIHSFLDFQDPLRKLIPHHLEGYTLNLHSRKFQHGMPYHICHLGQVIYFHFQQVPNRCQSLCWMLGHKIKDLNTAYPMFKVLCGKKINREVLSSIVRAVTEKAWDTLGACWKLI